MYQECEKYKLDFAELVGVYEYGMKFWRILKLLL